MRKTFLGALGFCWCRHKYFVKGTKKIDTSVDEQKVTIVYDPKKANYDAYVAAFKKQKSPQGCYTSWGWLVGRPPQNLKKRHLLVWLVTTLISAFLYYQYFAVNVLTLYAWNVMLFSLSI